MCQPMPSVPESVCCHEIGQIWQKIEEQTEVQMSCITEHPGFQSTCLDVWVLETAYFAYIGNNMAQTAIEGTSMFLSCGEIRGTRYEDL